MIRVLLLREMRKLGDIGDVVSVKNGYARNFLIPSGRAMRATPEAVVHFESVKDKLLQERAERLSATKSLWEKLHGMRLTIAANSSPDGKLYGSIGASMVTQEIVRHVPEADGILRKNQVRIPGGNVKLVGECAISISLERDYQADLTLAVTAEGQSGESSFGPAPAPAAEEKPPEAAGGPAAEQPGVAAGKEEAAK